MELVTHDRCNRLLITTAGGGFEVKRKTMHEVSKRMVPLTVLASFVGSCGGDRVGSQSDGKFLLSY
jgi:hypothetical protein